MLREKQKLREFENKALDRIEMMKEESGENYIM
jgi:hypothetical protein